MTNLEKALTDRFTDQSEINDIAKHGCAGGVSGFIYSSELFDFFQEHESDIEDAIHDAGLTPDAFLGEQWTFQEFREKAVWFCVEMWCSELATI